MTGLWVLLAAVALAVLIGLLLRHRSGRVAAVTMTAQPEQLATLLAEFGVVDPAGAPLLVHFSAPWCGPCAGVQMLVAQLGVELGWLRHTEVDVTTHPQLSAHLRVLSLPTVIVYDTGLQQRFRASGPPNAADLRAVLLPLAPGSAT